MKIIQIMSGLSLESGEQTLSAQIERADGSSFVLPLVPEQAEILVSESGLASGTEPSPQPAPSQASPRRDPPSQKTAPAEPDAIRLTSMFAIPPLEDDEDDDREDCW
jgi:hypothetical protein